MRRRTAWIVVIAVGLGVAAGWLAGRWQGNQDVRTIALAHQLETAGLCANSLTLARRPNLERLELLLVSRMRSAVQAGEQLTAEGATLHDIAAPNLREALRRAGASFEQANDAAYRDRSERLLAQLRGR